MFHIQDIVNGPDARYSGNATEMPVEVISRKCVEGVAAERLTSDYY
jgi:hypothetical protein